MNRAAVRAALGLALLGGGCRLADPPAGGLAAGLAEAPPRVGPRQAADVNVALGRSLEKQGEIPAAVNAYLDAAKRDPQRADAYLRLAVLYDRQGRFKESTEWYRKALRASPGNADVYADMGYSLYLQSRFAEAEMNLRQAVALKPEQPRVHNNLGLVLARTDRPEEALAHFRKAGTESDAHVNLALAYALDQRWGEARREYEAALEANPASEAGRRGLQQMNALAARTSPPAAPVAEAEARVAARPPGRAFQPVRAEASEERPAAAVSYADRSPAPAETPVITDPEPAPPPPPISALSAAPPERRPDADPPRRISQAVTFFHVEPAG
jgi:Tfp pilus assembly protein PilF